MGGQLSKHDIEVLKRNTNFSDAQIKEWYKTFKKDYPKGKVDKQGFKAIYERLFAPKWGRDGGSSRFPDALCNLVFRATDTDESGTVNFREMILAIDTMYCGKPQEKLSFAFKLCDVSGNGTISEKELVHVIEAIQSTQQSPKDKEKTIQKAKEIFNKLDQDDNQKVTYQEFISKALDDKEIYEQLFPNDTKE